MASTYNLDITKIPVYYINLKQSVEKREQMESMLRDLGFADINRFEAIEATPKRIGVAQSHLEVLKIVSKTKGPFLVLEDDAKNFKFEEEIKIPSDADAYYLGNSAFGLYNGVGKRKNSVSKFDTKTYKIHNMLAAHAIIYLNKEYVDFLIKALEFPISVKTNQDKARAETMKYWNVYASAVPMFYQSGVYEKHTKISLPYNRSVGPQGSYSF